MLPVDTLLAPPTRYIKKGSLFKRSFFYVESKHSINRRSVLLVCPRNVQRALDVHLLFSFPVAALDSVCRYSTRSMPCRSWQAIRAGLVCSWFEALWVFGCCSVLRSFCFFHNWQIWRLCKDINHCCRDHCSEGDQAKNGGWVIGHELCLWTYVTKLSGSMTKCKLLLSLPAWPQWRGFVNLR